MYIGVLDHLTHVEQSAVCLHAFHRLWKSPMLILHPSGAACFLRFPDFVGLDDVLHLLQKELMQLPLDIAACRVDI